MLQLIFYCLFFCRASKIQLFVSHSIQDEKMMIQSGITLLMKSSLQIKFWFPEHSRNQTIKKSTFVHCSEIFLGSMPDNSLASFLAQGKAIFSSLLYMYFSESYTHSVCNFYIPIFQVVFFVPRYNCCGIW